MSRVMLLLGVLLLFCYTVFAETVVLHMAQREGCNKYYRELLVAALQASGHQVAIRNRGHYPQVWRTKMLSEGKIDIDLYIPTPDHDARWTRIDCDILNGLIGYRILLVPRSQKQAYSQIQTLEQFRESGKVAGLGKGWHDVEIWQANALPFKISPTSWSAIYKAVASGQRGMDYFPRGFTEILAEARQHPDLAIEPHLMLVYDSAYCYYLSDKAAHYKPVIEQSLRDYMATRAYEELMQRHWAEDFKLLQPEKRRILRLRLPQVPTP